MLDSTFLWSRNVVNSYDNFRLFTDPVSKLDIPRTFENLGAVARSTFEHETTPMYHVRNLVGSAKDAVVAAMKIPNQNFITPSKYQIVDTMNDRLGDINEAAVSQDVEDEMTKTFQKVSQCLPLQLLYLRYNHHHQKHTNLDFDLLLS